MPRLLERRNSSNLIQSYHFLTCFASMSSTVFSSFVPKRLKRSCRTLDFLFMLRQAGVFLHFLDLLRGCLRGERVSPRMNSEKGEKPQKSNLLTRRLSIVRFEEFMSPSSQYQVSTVCDASAIVFAGIPSPVLAVEFWCERNLDYKRTVTSPGASSLFVRPFKKYEL